MPRRDSQRKYLMISAVAERFEIHPQTLRLYEREGLIAPPRSKGNTRLYDEDTLSRLETILTLTRDLGVNLAYADGFSHALSTPTYEDGPGGGKEGARYPTQHYIGIEMALGWLTLPEWQVVTRIHHRSGIWGIFAPQGVGSNFFTIGLRWRG